MTLKLLDLQYLRAQNTSTGQVLVTGSSLGVEITPSLVVRNGRVGIGSSNPSQALSVAGNVAVFGSAGYYFSDGSLQSTAAVTMLPGGTPGAVQFNDSGSFGGINTFCWISSTGRLGIGNDNPLSTLQIKDVGYESTNTSVDDLSTVTLDSFPVPNYRSCHYIVQVTDTNNSWFHTTQIMLIHDGLNAFKSEYNIVTTHERLGSFDCTVDTGNVLLTFTPFYTSDKNIKVIRTSIEP